MKTGTQFLGLNGGDLINAVENGGITEETPVVTVPEDGTLVSVHRLDTSPHFNGAFERFAVLGSRVTSVMVTLTPAERDGREPVPSTVGESLVYKMARGE